MVNLVNFRDFSEITKNSEVKIKSGKLFRSANFDDLTLEIENFLVEQGVEYLVDLRTKEESKMRKYSITHPDLHYVSVPAIPLKKNIHDIFITEKLKKDSTSQEIRNSAHFIHNMYKRMPFNNSALRFVFSEMKNGSSLLFHCSSGKDRTGIMTALILEMFGVEEDIIFHDYLASNVTINDGLNQFSWEMDFDEEQHDAFMWASKVHRHLLEDTFRVILNKYVDFDGYFYGEYGLNEVDIARIKDFYLDS